jgi:hypothetical protein
MPASETRPQVGVAFAAGSEARFDIRQPDIIAPALGADLDVVAEGVVAAIDQHIADAGCSHVVEGDLLRLFVTRSSSDNTSACIVHRRRVAGRRRASITRPLLS